MSKNLVIVESPAKAKTIKKYLGRDVTVMASFGHVRDLLPKAGAVEPENDFAMHYEVIDKNKKHVEAIRKALKEADTLYLAPDPDREGEAIAWHLYQMMKDKGALKNKAVYRIAFNQITKSAVQNALKNPRHIDMNLVNAQQARRALDYLVGFNLSPLLWKKVKRGLSAGRVQSPALRLIVERESEIEQFVAQEYWSIEALCAQEQQQFAAKLTKYVGQKIEQFSITDAKKANQIKDKLMKVGGGQLIVEKVDKKLRKRNPAAPFITSTLQQEASRKLGFSTKKTMMVAQQLYEGLDVGIGTSGLITYMRTDSVHLADEAIAEIREFIAGQYGDQNLPDAPRVFTSKVKNAQEAHEAIRPTTVKNRPEMIKSALTSDQYKLYELIWKRTVASQMIHATINAMAVDLLAGKENYFRANGSTVVDPGFMVVYKESDDANKGQSEEVMLPELQEGDKVKLLDVSCHQHFTEPPPRYTEASLVKTLEEYGIGRPSTYATIISTLLQREYAVLQKKHFYPTDVGKIVNRFLTEYFAQYVDYNFTADLEDTLDAISRGEKVWIPVLKVFWEPFKNRVDEITERVKRQDVASELLEETCPECGKQLVIRLGRRGRFIGCKGYPDCKYTRNLESEAEAEEPALVEGRFCPKCGAELQIKHSRYGKFIGCSRYPDCKYTESLDKQMDTGVTCPECYKGTLLKRISRRQRVFYSCSRYPDCQYSVWNEPIAEVCPKCHWPILTIKTTKRRGTEKMCPQKNCGYMARKTEDRRRKIVFVSLRDKE
jgi:DNA topoisomerase-1